MKKERKKQLDVVEKFTRDKELAERRELISRINDVRIRQFELVLEYNDLCRQAYRKMIEIWELPNIPVPPDMISSGELIKPFVSTRDYIPPRTGLEEVDVKKVVNLIPMGYSEYGYRVMIEGLKHERIG